MFSTASLVETLFKVKSNIIIHTHNGLEKCMFCSLFKDFFKDALKNYCIHVALVCLVYKLKLSLLKNFKRLGKTTTKDIAKDNDYE